MIESKKWNEVPKIIEEQKKITVTNHRKKFVPVLLSVELNSHWVNEYKEKGWEQPRRQSDVPKARNCTSFSEKRKLSKYAFIFS
jgi:hypothetical protein